MCGSLSDVTLPTANERTASKFNKRSRPTLTDTRGIHLLLYDCARAVPREDAVFRAKVECITDWDQLLGAAFFHGLGPLLCAAILHACPNSIPADVHSALSDSRRDSVAYDLFLYRELVRLLRLLEEEDIKAIPLKGPVLARTLYSDSSLRPYSDLDILVTSQDIYAVLHILGLQGYEAEPYLARLSVRKLMSLRGEVTLRHRQGQKLDLHKELAQSNYPFRIDPAVLWDWASVVEFNGVAVPALRSDVLLIFLCVHGAKHAWSRLIWLADVARLALKNPDWESAFALAARIGCERPLLLGLLLAHDVLDTAIPEAYLERARLNQTVASAARTVKRRLESNAPAEPTPLELTAFNARLATRWWDKVRHIAALLKSPTDAELKWVWLPPRLFFLYYPLRLYRLISRHLFPMFRES